MLNNDGRSAALHDSDETNLPRTDCACGRAHTPADGRETNGRGFGAATTALREQASRSRPQEKNYTRSKRASCGKRQTEGEEMIPLTQIGERPEGCHVPMDIETANDRWGANCGPVSLAAFLGLEVEEVRPWFAHFPERTWTTMCDMQQALRSANISIADEHYRIPSRGLLLVQFEGPWKRHRNASRYRHWLAVNNNYVFDLNWPQWLPIKIWSLLVFPKFRQIEPAISGWSPLRALELDDAPTWVCADSPRPNQAIAALFDPLRVRVA